MKMATAESTVGSTGRRHLRDVEMEVQRLPGQLLGGVVKDAREGDLGRARRRLGAVGALHLVRHHQAG